MKWLSHRCARYQESVCLLVSDALTPVERTTIESHLSSCAGCRQYYDQIKSVAAPLANWVTQVAHLRVSEAAQTGWANAIQLAGQKKPKHFISRFGPELFLPVRWHLAGMSALWLLIALLNLDYSPPSTTSVKVNPQRRQFLIALQENRRQLLQW